MSTVFPGLVPASPEALGGRHPLRVRAGGERPYDVLIGQKAASAVISLLPERAKTVALVIDESLSCQVRSIRAALEADDRRVAVLQIPQGESAKQIGVLAGVWSRLAAAGVTGADVVVAFGGGATLDLAGFAAATWRRGVPLVLVPTTLLGMVDAAVGGAAGINVPEGRELVGVWHPPAGVVCDPELLATVPEGGHLGGLAEMIKAGFVGDPVILDLIAADPVRATRPAGCDAAGLIERAVRVKTAALGRQDGEAAWSLAYGHTLGRAIERVEHYRVPPGHALAVGMVFAAELARLADRLDDESVERHREVLAAVGLPTSYPREAWAGLRKVLTAGSGDDAAPLVVLDAIGRPGLLHDPEGALQDEAYRRMSS
ncbi:iron-containing alcohol dehydrogenase [Streptomyces sp. ISL-10]|uniref:3-dehydroquinate synthase family protein n=1 Tax=Streptomyces sp. ISL-10 TaxID=2819172 RepID=UPI001BEA84D5|nr:3-dehydroquinate synthase family protein [Streptomyces sp. ISL-10]MBT2369095.1 iron-containing alcohol dehydrogenase [Streptomyces sp. ISL-10]